MTERLFLAVPLDDDARTRIRTRVPRPLPGRATLPEQWHLTLRFLGDVDGERRDALIREMERTDLGDPFSLRMGGLGAFPRPDRARVIWLGVDRGEAELSSLRNTVERTVRAIGFAADSKPFRPHLTLSRLRPSGSVARLMRESQAPAVTVAVEAVVLYRSHLGQGPARHEAVRIFPLAGA